MRVPNKIWLHIKQSVVKLRFRQMKLLRIKIRRKHKPGELPGSEKFFWNIAWDLGARAKRARR